MNKLLKKINNFLNSFLFDNKKLALFWFNGENNFGDEINKFLVENLSGKKVVHVLPKYFFRKHYFCIGSILERVQKNSIIWGSGFISKDSKVIKPKKIYAVRGPKTRQKFLESNIECPEVYGDPALLLPMFYTPSFRKKYKIGVIPHYTDKKIVEQIHIFKTRDVKIIDIQQNNYLNFIEEVSQCEFVISSSLHGLIISDAYSIDNIWVKFSENLIGNDFKFYDYFESVNRKNEKPYSIQDNPSLQDIINSKNNYEFKIDLEKLLRNCPFHNMK